MVTMFRGRHENREEQASQDEHRNGDVMPQIENEFRELVRRRGVPRLRAESGNGDANDVNSLAQNISGPAVVEIEKLITQLHDMRDHLVHESHRVERAITEYAQMSQATTNSTRLIAEHLTKWASENRRANSAATAVPEAQAEGAPAGGGQTAA
jgi:hypothetical protein